MNKCGTIEKKKMKIIASILALSTPFTLVSCLNKDKDEVVDDSVLYSDSNLIEYNNEKNNNSKDIKQTVIDNDNIVSSAIDNYLNDYTNISKKENKEGNESSKTLISSNSSQKSINDILNIKYCSNDRYFKLFDFDNAASIAQKKINNESIKHKSNSEYDNKNYSWLKNGKIDSNELIQKLEENCRKNNINITNSISTVINMVPNILNSSINYLNKRYGNYDLKVFYHNLDCLYFNAYDNTGYNAYYECTNNMIVMDNKIINSSIKDIEAVLSHEFFHLLFRKDYKEEYLYLFGASTPVGSNDVFEMNFIEEYCASCFSFYRKGESVPYIYNYDSSEELINLLALSCNTTQNYIMDLWVTNDKDGFRKLFVQEMQDINYVFSTISALSKGSGFGFLVDGCDEIGFKNECISYAFINMYKNKMICCINKINKGDMTKGEMDNELNLLLNNLKKLQYSNYNQDLVFKTVNELNDVSKEITKNDTKIR